LQDLKSLTTRLMKFHIKEKNLSLPKEIYLQRELIFYHRALNGIQFIRDLELGLNDKLEWRIEKPFKIDQNISLDGRIDCIGLSNKYVILLDFKSTEFSASSSSDVNDYQALQLWVYAHASEKIIGNRSVILGYVVLDDASKSNILTSDEEAAKLIKDAQLCKVHRFKDEFNLKLAEAQKKITSLMLSIQTEKEFKANPRKDSTCYFCELNKVCIKGEIVNV
jgi:hypothetical protein